MNKLAEMYEKERYLTNTMFTENEQLKRKIAKLEKALNKACVALESLNPDRTDCEWKGWLLNENK